MNPCSLYFRYVSISLRSQMQYRGSFILLMVASFLLATCEFAIVWLLVNRFQSIGGWDLPEVATLFAISSISFTLGDAASRGFDQFSTLVRSGDFDTMLLRPRSTALQVAGQDFQVMRLGKVIQGLLVLGWAMSVLPGLWSWSSLLLIAAAIFAGACVFYALFIIQATMVFWTTESLEVMNIFTFGGHDLSKYPMSIYQPWFRQFFTFVIPLAWVTYFPLVTLFDKPAAFAWIGWLAPLVGFLFLMVALSFWNLGVRHYRSTGS